MSSIDTVPSARGEPADAPTTTPLCAAVIDATPRAVSEVEQSADAGAEAIASYRAPEASVNVEGMGTE